MPTPLVFEPAAAGAGLRTVGMVSTALPFGPALAAGALPGEDESELQASLCSTLPPVAKKWAPIHKFTRCALGVLCTRHLLSKSL
jgi:hypothetical protein